MGCIIISLTIATPLSYIYNSDEENESILDIYDDDDDDNDGIPTSVELQYHLNPYDASDANGDLDHDGLSNLFEYEHNMSINDADMDHDGINDGDELHYWNVTRGLPLNESIAYCKNPDVDNDSIPDGKEIKGYTVKIITGWDSKGTPISEKRFISPSELDPLTPYTNSSGVYLDTDRDGIPDVVEKWFGNASIVTNQSYRKEFIATFGWNLYHKYSWVIGYFWTIYDRDYKEHHNKTSAMQNATQWLQDQFNPMVRDRTPPVITLFKLSWDVQFSLSSEPVKVFAVVHLIVRDVGGIYSLRIMDESSGVVYTVDVSAHHTMYDVQHRFKASALDAAFGAVKIRIITADYAGNTLSVEKKLKGALQHILDALAKLWSAIWSVLCKVAEAVANAVNVILKWLVDAIMDKFSAMLSSAKSIINPVLSRLIMDIIGIYSGNISFAQLLRDIMLSQIFMITFGFAIALTILNYVIMSTGIGTMILAAISAAVLIMLGITIIGIGINFVLNPTENILDDWIQHILLYICTETNKNDNVRANILIKESDSEMEDFETLLEAISWFVLPFFWIIGGALSENEWVLGFTLFCDIITIYCGMVFEAMKQYNFNKTLQVQLLQGIMAMDIMALITVGIGALLAAGDNNQLVAVFDVVVFVWTFIALGIHLLMYENITSSSNSNENTNSVEFSNFENIYLDYSIKEVVM